MHQFLLLLLLLLSLTHSAEIYQYNVDALLPYEVPGTAKILLPAHFVCHTGWVALVTPPYHSIYICNQSLHDQMSPQFQLRDQAFFSLPFDIDPSLIISIDTPWVIEGECNSVVNLCAPPGQDTVWTRDCEGSVVATYHVCTNAIMVAVDAQAVKADWVPYHNEAGQATVTYYRPVAPVVSCGDAASGVLFEACLILVAVAALGLVLCLASVGTTFWLTKQYVEKQAEYRIKLVESNVSSGGVEDHMDDL